MLMFVYCVGFVYNIFYITFLVEAIFAIPRDIPKWHSGILARCWNITDLCFCVLTIISLNCNTGFFRVTHFERLTKAHISQMCILYMVTLNSCA